MIVEYTLSDQTEKRKADSFTHLKQSVWSNQVSSGRLSIARSVE